ncbi:MAG: hypothetical protein DHS20C21_14260 [Gemmatimonadota bacterium]|nr:MAG: hypothetical protein DHS20C21_14260 [Gemmatimonadota bacterium]
MNLRMTYKTAALALLMLPLLGATCAKDKLIALIIDADLIGVFQASGELNVHSDTDTINLRDELNLDQVVADQGVDVHAIDPDALKVKRIFYKIVTPEAGRSITNGQVSLDGISLATGLTVSAATATDWIDITTRLSAGGVIYVNSFLKAVVLDLQNGTSNAPPTVTYSVSGNSLPADDPTDFVWSVKLEITGIVKQEYTLPDF